MDLIIQAFVLLVSVLVLAKSSHIVIHNAVSLARFTRLDELVIGFLIISVTTSLPELAVSISSVLKGNIGVSVGNLLGSNITDICLIVGIVALLKPMKVSKWTFRDLSAILFLTSVVPIFLLFIKEAGQLIGVVLLALFVFFCGYSLKQNIVRRHRRHRKANTSKIPHMDKVPILLTTAFLLAGIGGVVISSSFAVDSALNVASIIGIAPTVIGAAVVAVGTSLPELSVNLAALRTKHYNLALGDAIGACMTNASLNLGIVLLVAPVTVNISVFSTLIFFLLLANLFMWYFLELRKLTHREGLLLLIIYNIFLATTFEAQVVLFK